MVICLEQGADCLYMVQPMALHPKTPSSPASYKSRLVLPFWYWLTQVVLEKRPLNIRSSSSSSYSRLIMAFIVSVVIVIFLAFAQLLLGVISVHSGDESVLEVGDGNV